MTEPRESEVGRGAGFGLLSLLLVAFVARLPAVFFSHGYEFLDEQFQYVDPAYYLATGTPFHQTYEWVEGIRSWVYPGLLSGVMRVPIALGVTDPYAQMTCVRAIAALFSLLGVVGIHHMLAASGVRVRRSLALLAVANGVLIYQSVHPNGLAFSCVLILFAVGMVVRGGRARALAAGLAVGLAFCCRPQDGLYGIPLFAAALLRRRWVEAFGFAAGCVAMLAVQGIVDLYTWGAWFHSAIEYVRYNLAHSSDWGRQPWWLYPVVLLGFAPILHVGLAAVGRGARLLPLVAAAAACSLLAHQMLARKAVRFVTPAIALWTTLWVVGMANVRGCGRWLRAAMLLAWIAHGVLYLAASFGYGNRQRVETATFLSAQEDNRGVVYCGLNATDCGGTFYYRTDAPRYVVPAAELTAFLATADPAPSHLVARKTLLIAPGDGWHLEPLATFRKQLGFSDKRAYAVYRLSRD